MASTEQRRRQRLADLLTDRGVPAALVTRPVNVRYLTGLASSNAALLIAADGAAVLATDFRYVGAAPDDVDVCETRDVGGALVQRAAETGLDQLAIEEHDLTVEAYDRVSELAAGHRVHLTKFGRGVERLRMVKDEAELSRIRRACAIADEALSGLFPTIRAGRTEGDVARDLDDRMRALGAEAPSFETIVATGPNSAIPHHRPTERPLARGDFVKLDFGALVDGYCSDMTRTWVLGSPAGWQREIHEVVRRAQEAGRAAAVAGAPAADVDAAARSVVTEAGYGEAFPHGLGHGVGLEIHEAPILREGAADRLEANVPVTVEPGVYLPGRGGVRIEDTIVVQPTPGGPHVLTQTSRDLLVL